MKTIKVVAAVICDSLQTKTRIFATARGYGEFKGQWEFPGGKIEHGETPQQALVREIREELATEIKVGELIDTVEYDYPGFHLSMDCFWCEVIEGDLILLEAQEARWLTKDELDSVKWLPADLGKYLYWKTNPEWYDYDNNEQPYLTEKAPEKAQESFKNYLELVERQKQTDIKFI